MKPCLLLTFIISLGLGSNLVAATVEWDNIGTAWSVGADWVGGMAPADDTTTDTAAFGATGSPQKNPNLTAARSVAGVTFLSNAYSYTVGGSALTIGVNGIGNGAVLSTQTFSNQINTSGSQIWSNQGALNFNGTVNLNNAGATAQTLSLNGGGSTIFNGVIQNSAPGSTGNLTYTGDSNGSLTLANANTYNGTTLINTGTVIGTHDTALGSGNVSLVGNTAQLRLQGGITNDYINNSATLSVSNGATLVLNFVGTDVVGAFVVNGVNQPLGVYSAVNENGLISGTGTITVVPEPTTWVTIVGGLGLMALVLRWRRQSLPLEF